MARRLNDLEPVAMAGHDDDEICFAAEVETNPTEKSWKILIVDDEVEVHTVTQLALRDFTFEDRHLSFMSAYSAQDAKQLMRDHPDTAIIFLDVVMESETAGLELVKYIRDDLDNQLVRLILRTGQPGQAPEDVVAMNYGIDDYKTKTELTSQKLAITVVTALRAFSTLQTMIETSRRLELALTQYQQTEAQEREKNQQIEQSLQMLQQRDRIENLSQLITEVTQDLIQVSQQADTSYTMSMITRIARILLRITDEHSARLGISQNKLATLLYLSSEPEQCASPSTLAKHCDISRAAMTGLLDGLEQEGYVERDSHPSDRRALQVRLTSKGQKFLAGVTAQDDQTAGLKARLDQGDRTKLIELAMRVVQLLEEQQDEH
jgi:DNA-binding MarR family transcriptional regulator